MDSTSVITLNEQQKQALAAVKSGRNVFITGSAGTGKSMVIQYIKDMTHSMGKSIRVTAMTGVAAANVGGSTMHSWAGIGLGKSEPRKHAFYIKKSENALHRYLDTDILVIDEVSMADFDYINKVNAVAKLVRSNMHKPFGGIQLVLSGDFFQLGPVQKNKATKFLFEDYVWPRIVDVSIHLKQIYRQTNTDFQEILQKIRVGDVDEDVIKKIDSTKNHKLAHTNGVRPTILFCRNLDVDAINSTSIKKIDGELFKSKSIDYYKDDDYKKLYEKSFTVQENVELKVGAQVMLLINLNVEAGLVNGSRGVVTKFVRNRGPDDDEDTDPEDYTGDIGYIRVKFANDTVENIAPYKQEFRDDEDSHEDPPKAYRTQYPLRLAYALTIHKSQGLSIDCLEIDMRGCFAHGQAYVALSRATSFEKLRVKNFSRKCIITSEVVKNFYREIDSNKKRPRGAIEAMFQKNKKAREEHSAEIDSNICYICVEPDALPNMVAVPCGHGGVCKGCSTKLKSCPKCRKTAKFMQVYLT
jgi:ATP-dependent DNA helicase PIF1